MNSRRNWCQARFEKNNLYNHDRERINFYNIVSKYINKREIKKEKTRITEKKSATRVVVSYRIDDPKVDSAIHH